MNVRRESASQMQMGPASVDRWGSKWAVFSLLVNVRDPVSIHADYIDAVAEAARLNAKEKR